MSKLSKEQVQRLIALVSETEPDEMTCDDCLQSIAEFAEASLEERELAEGLQAVQRHLEQCVCCRDEYNALIDALKQIDQES